MPVNFRILFIFGILTVCTALVQHHPFFWDTVQLGSKHAHFFYNNRLRWAPLPVEIDSGHPPVFGYFLAVVWTVFGKTLPAGHWAMLPFLLGIAGLLYLLGQRLSDERWAWWLLPVVLLDPVMAGQCTLVGPDLVLIFFFLLALEGTLRRKSFWVTIGILGLCSISTRGMMTAAALFIWQLAASWRPAIFFTPLRNNWLIFVPGFGFAVGFILWHLSTSGWIGYHPGSPWAASFELVGLAGLPRNVLIIGWRWLDLGRFIEWIVLIYLVWINLKKKTEKCSIHPQLATMLLLFFCLVLFLTPSALLYRNLSAHRYLLPLFVGFHLLIFHLLARTELSSIKKQLLLVCIILGLSTGNLWIYPRGISMDWDATLAYLPYHNLRTEMLRYLEERQIEFSTVGSTFPNVNTGEHLQLNGDFRQFADKDFTRNAFMIASNIFNDFSEEDYWILEHEWTLDKKFERHGVWMALYSRGK